MLASILALALHGVPGAALLTTKKHTFGVEDMLAMQRISEVVASPDGQELAFSVRETDMAANRGRYDLYTVAFDGTKLRRLTSHPENDNAPSYAADGQSIYFLSSRSGSSQVWRISRTGGEAEQLTQLPLDVNGYRLFPDGKRLLVALDVLPSGVHLTDTTAFVDKQKTTKARIYDELLYRHWDTWEDGLRSHLFVWSPDKPSLAVDLMPGVDADAPTHPWGGMEETEVSRDGKTVYFTMRSDGAQAAWSTNMDLYQVATDGRGKLTNLTADNKATDSTPALSPDGRTLAYLAMARPKYESDRMRITLLDLSTGKRRTLTEAWDRSPGAFAWASDGKSLWATADHVGHSAVFSVDATTGAARPIHTEGWSSSPVAVSGGVVFLRDHLRAPGEIFTMRADGSEFRAITAMNKARSEAILWALPEQFSFQGAKGETVFGWMLPPAGGVKPGQKVPLAFLIHGGPQGSFGDHFHYRWNPQVYAGHGYATVMIDFHGSTGYGQAFTDAINDDWGGAPYEDLMKGLDFVLSKYTFVDPNKLTALGASYGGFMINWINGHTTRFKALVNHDGNLDERMAYFDTEELWFPEWDHGGTPWENPAGYSKHNPIDHVKNWKTPTLVIHGARDYRVVDTQGMSTFTALRRQGIPSRFIYFPDENHWVLKPDNSRLWHQEVLAWLDKWARR